MVVAVPFVDAARSSLLQWRDAIYIGAGFAGIVGLVLLVLQPMSIAGLLPGVAGRKLHRWTGMGLVVAVVTHVMGLWITSPPDVVDVLLFRSPTPFSIWGAVAMWAVFAAALLAGFRRKIRLNTWRIGHIVATITIVIGTIIHAWLVEGPMGSLSKGMISLFAIATLSWALWQRRIWRFLRRTKPIR